MTTEFANQLARLKAAVGLSEDQEVAQLLDMTKSALFGRKKRGAFPDDKLYALAAKRPELGIDVAYVLTGEKVSRLSPAARGHVNAVAANAGRLIAEGSPAADDLASLVRKNTEHFVSDAGVREQTVREIAALLELCSNETLTSLRQLVGALAMGQAKASKPKDD